MPARGGHSLLVQNKREEKTQEDRLQERLRATESGRHYISILFLWQDEIRIC